MYCQQCGTTLYENTKLCSTCGAQQNQFQTTCANVKTGLVGFSNQISNPAFTKYINNTNLWSAIFAAILAVVAIVGFTIAGEIGADNMENPRALFIGLGIGGMFLLIALFQILGRKRSSTWDGTVSDKRINKKRRRQNTGDGNYYWVDYIEYVVTINNRNGELHQINVEDDDTLYNYYQVGDQVRHHAGLNTYEKYDKSKDDIIFCAACASLNDINDDYCFRCKCPLLK